MRFAEPCPRTGYLSDFGIVVGFRPDETALWRDLIPNCRTFQAVDFGRVRGGGKGTWVHTALNLESVGAGMSSVIIDRNYR